VDIPVVGWPGDGSVGGWRSGNATELGQVYVDYLCNRFHIIYLVL